MLWIAGSIVIAAILISSAIAFDDLKLSIYELRLAQVFATLGGGGAVLIGAFRYVWERQQELAWQKTEFMIGLFREFEKEETLRRAQTLMDDAIAKKDDTYLATILGPVEDLDDKQTRDRNAMDRYLDFFDHLSTYVFITKTLRSRDIISFSGYVIDILDSPVVSEFAFAWGYDDVLGLALHFRDEAEESRRAEQTDRLRQEVEKKRRDWKESEGLPSN